MLSPLFLLCFLMFCKVWKWIKVCYNIVEKMSGSMECDYIPSAWNITMQRKCKKGIGKVVPTHECVFSMYKGWKIKVIYVNYEVQSDYNGNKHNEANNIIAVGTKTQVKISKFNCKVTK